ncbi:hypothetical protein [Klebsiella quasipneumoniae]|uniref:hypothetical protein n=1 Tax=Klebsiella quasipneumoniae TaxID=1463165 RepID=UPI000C79C363|nr:hypothetical protein [Klebsiella quasipneumoniae]PLJ29899.1 hypothetical protein B6J62_19075 [Klebsiella quasipneumoniae]
MPRYLHVYRAPSGQWSGKVLEEVAGIAGCEHPVEVLESALEQYEGIEDLPKDAVLDGDGTATVELHPKAVELLGEYAATHDVDLRTYIEALANYAISCELRPGSWEANRPFEFATYDKRGETYADQWF